MKNIGFLACCLLAPPAFAQEACPQCPPALPGMLCVELTYQDNPARLCVVSTFNAGPDWFIVNEGMLPEKIEQAPPVAMSQIAELQISPQQKYLAVVSVGEGHPLLDVFDLPALLQNPSQDALYSLNPYPGGVAVGRWLEEGRLALIYDDFGTAGPPEIPPCAEGGLVLHLPDKRLRCEKTPQK